jgi:hypothetical protein
MKIQEMRSGITHLNKRGRIDGRDNRFELPTLADMMPMLDTILPTPAMSELDERRWSVLSFDKVEAARLTYDEAAVRLSDLDSCGVAGLCIVTDEVAGRVRG